MSESEVDLFVIGAGSGGVRAARVAATHGARVVVAEEHRVGGTCVIRGCIPKKLYVYASRFRDEFEEAAGFGWTLSQPPSFDWQKLVAAKEKEISRLSAIYRENLGRAGVKIVETRAVVEGPNMVRLANGSRVRAKHILVAVGASPSIDFPLPGLDLTISSSEVFDLPRFPQRLLVVGGGYIAVEFASVFARLGAEVTQVMRGENVLRGFDGDMRVGLRDALVRAHVQLHFGIMPVEITARGNEKRVKLSNGKTIVVDQILVATGRRPHTRDLGLEGAGVRLAKSGAVVVDAYSQTNIPSIFAVGDVTDRLNLTPVAIREGQAFANTVFGGTPTAVVHTNVPTAVFTTPELGVVGLSEEEARQIFDVVDIYSADFRPLKATLSGGQDRTIMKIVVDGATDRVLGVHILGENAGEMAQLIAIAIRTGVKKSDLDATMAVHPTAAEELVTMHARRARHEREEINAGPGAATGEP